MVYMPRWPRVLECRVPDFKLDRVAKILERIGNPEKLMPPVIHVAGTNGKGSTIAFLAHILRAAGIRTHVYTSPHLVEFNERIVLDGTKITDAYLDEILEECRLASEGIQVTFFEATTAAAFLAFSRVAADITLVEVGMGGRLDATNVVTPILSIITSISLDHTDSLGSTVELIAGEKSGIIKRGVSCVVAPQYPESIMRTIEYYAMRERALLYRGNIEWFCSKGTDGMVFTSGEDVYEFPLPSLLGDHQIINAGNAVAACSILSGKFHYKIDYEDIVSGITNTRWPARLEMITGGFVRKLLPDNWKMFLDGAHNPSGAQALSYWAERHTDGGLYLILGMTRGKDGRAFLSYMKKYIKFLCAVCVKSEPRAKLAEEIVQEAMELNIPASAESDIQSSIKKILSIGDPGAEATVLVCGSLFLAGDLLKENTMR
ncbi:bifunctional folylpolyglutamate synthase/dihydrofolate synthase [Anaplasma capra]|uniref:bifunctional folylpolyglutamate synthase/dihydrofolate synthase n=1 Tax=Anaplasma capra TaxID=1562740 RepID=UPI0021D5A4CF|nr:folylpolyglutamate synthase/dihydrofolate synthase family protein [Anaplasma capra]MCU7611948.1 bifunctional folylpolyglutamate synthase/dihydrofolate synthase [Anaplasma capra]MCU7612272.1 bifunctional folylpolyglutamate synthase/dihydrofolate synthase [Anaplasma capra]